MYGSGHSLWSAKQLLAQEVNIDLSVTAGFLKIFFCNLHLHASYTSKSNEIKLILYLFTLNAGFRNSLLHELQ